ncbi:MAG: hypothetical protein U0572_08805 [Phycisphaerales bacterium]
MNRVSLSLSLSLYAPLMLASSAVAGVLRYEFVDVILPGNVALSTVGDVVPAEINNQNVAVGYYLRVSDSQGRPFIWTANGAFGLAAGEAYDIEPWVSFPLGGRLTDINGAGQAVGGRWVAAGGGTEERACELAFSFGPTVSLTMVATPSASVLFGINDGTPVRTVGSRAAGSCIGASSQYYAFTHLAFSASAPVDLQNATGAGNSAHAINSSAAPLVAGDTNGCANIFECSPTWDATRWNAISGLATFVPESGNFVTRAFNINEVSELAGAVENDGSSCTPRARLWSSTFVETALGELLPDAFTGGSYSIKSYAFDLSNSLPCGRQFVVGTNTAFQRGAAWWRCGSTWTGFYLTDSVSPLQPGVPAGWYANDAKGVNDAGWVVGSGYASGYPAPRGFVLKPILCPADFDGDGTVGSADLGLFLGAFGCQSNPGAGCWRYDLTADGVVNGADLALVTGGWGPCPCNCTTNDAVSGGGAAASALYAGVSTIDFAAAFGFASMDDLIVWMQTLGAEELDGVAAYMIAISSGGA